jgi:hypothetical protein
VQSSQLAEVGFDEKTRTLSVKFNSGGVYHYPSITKSEYENLINSKSIGSHFHGLIKGRQFKQVHDHKAK